MVDSLKPWANIGTGLGADIMSYQYFSMTSHVNAEAHYYGKQVHADEHQHKSDRAKAPEFCYANDSDYRTISGDCTVKWWLRLRLRLSVRRFSADNRVHTGWCKLWGPVAIVATVTTTTNRAGGE